MEMKYAGHTINVHISFIVRKYHFIRSDLFLSDASLSFVSNGAICWCVTLAFSLKIFSFQYFSTFKISIHGLSITINS